MTKAPKIPPEQQSPGGEEPDVAGDSGDRRDRRTDVRTGQPGDAGLNKAQEGRFGNINQNTHNVGYQQDR